MNFQGPASYGASRAPDQYPIAMMEQALLAQRQAIDQESMNIRAHLKTTLERYDHIKADLEGSQAQNARDTNTISHLQARIAELNEFVEKQKKTISNQSKLISEGKHVKPQHPSSAPGMGPLTPHRQGPIGQLPTPFDTPFAERHQFSGVYEQPPPRFDAAGAVSSSASSFIAPVPALSQPVAFESVAMSPESGPIYDNSLPDLNIALDKNMVGFAVKFNNLWLKTETFGQLHANVPSVYKDSHLDKRVKDYIMTVSNASSASFLLNNTNTRYFLVAKAINSYLLNDVLKITVIKGFDVAADAEVGSIKRQLYPDTPTSVRNMMVVAMVNQMKDIKTKPGFTEFCQQRAHEHTTKLWQLIGPLTSDSSSQAWMDLWGIVCDAQALAVAMYSEPYEYRTEFPDINEPFSPATMVNRDIFFRADPEMLKNNDMRVRLGITPVMRIRCNTGATAVIKLVALGGVLLRAPPKH